MTPYVGIALNFWSCLYRSTTKSHFTQFCINPWLLGKEPTNWSTNPIFFLLQCTTIPRLYRKKNVQSMLNFTIILNIKKKNPRWDDSFSWDKCWKHDKSSSSDLFCSHTYISPFLLVKISLFLVEKCYKSKDFNLTGQKIGSNKIAK